MPTARAYFDSKALEHNLSRVKALAPQAQVLAMLKAEAYGHGLLASAKALSHADAFGVAHTDEALFCRQHYPNNSIVVMTGFHTPEELQDLSQAHIDVVLHHDWQAECLLQARLQRPIRVWLKIDTGMHRLGFDWDNWTAVYKQLVACSQVKEIILMSHFAVADSPNALFTQQQLARFKNQTDGFTNTKSLANSAGILTLPESHFDWVRPGIMLYGVSPLENKTAEALGLKPVMTLKAKLIAINQLKKGESIGYGQRFHCTEDMPIGVVAIGYGDGYPRHAADGTPVLINGKICPLAGRVSMDTITVDLRNAPKANIGDEVVLWGEGLPAEEVAQCADTIAYELFTSLTSRVKRIW